MRIVSKRFEDFNIEELYELLAFRSEIFVVEQECAYQEMDGHDQLSLHILGTIKNQLVATARIVPPGGTYDEASIGRVAVHKDFRGRGLAREIFTKALKMAKTTYAGQDIRVQAQEYLERFYQDFGFETISEPYPDVGIWHIDMIFKEDKGK